MNVYSKLVCEHAVRGVRLSECGPEYLRLFILCTIFGLIVNMFIISAYRKARIEKSQIFVCATDEGTKL